MASLIQEGADVNRPDGRLETLRALLASGADPALPGTGAPDRSAPPGARVPAVSALQWAGRRQMPGVPDLRRELEQGVLRRSASERRKP